MNDHMIRTIAAAARRIREILDDPPPKDRRRLTKKRIAEIHLEWKELFRQIDAKRGCTRH